jgi:nucleotide-binding universal stress UspA family protein
MDVREHKIVVGYDGSDDSELALSWAIRTAKGSRAAIEVVNALPAPPWELAYTTEDAVTQRDKASKLVAAATRRVEASGIPVNTEIARAPAAEALIAAADDADMIVVGSRGHARLVELMIGSVSQHAARHARCPVVVVRPPADQRADRVVVGLDWSSESGKAVGFAFEIAAQHQAPLVAVHAFRSEGERPVGPHNRARGIAEQTAAHERLLTEMTAAWQEKFPDVELTKEAIPVGARQLLRDFSTRSALLVLGARGSGAFAALRLGSVADSMLHHARCSVAIVR